MLIELRIRDYALIDDVALETGPGLHVLSGETGAGKSIIVGALSLLLGERASSEGVREGADKASVEAVFDVSALPVVRDRLDELGFEPEEGLLILRREVAAAGRSRAWVNGSPTTVRVIGELGRSLVDLHGQHEHQTLLRRDDQLGILDAFAGVADRTADVRRQYRSLTELRARSSDLDARGRDLETRVDFLRFQRSEIADARLEPGEDAALQDEAKRLEHAQELMSEAGRIHSLLYAGDDSLADRLAEARSSLERLTRWDPELEDTISTLKEAYELVSEVGRTMGAYADRVEHDPPRLAEARERLDLLFKLMRKYGPELQDVIETGARVSAELDELDGASLDHDALSREIEAASTALVAAASELATARQAAAAKLAEQVEGLLPELGLPGAVFVAELTPLPEVGPMGSERVEFLVSLNPGVEPRSLARVASGGELSRVMLALKAVLARVDAVPTLIFDEIDAGIGGVVATHVAEKLRDVAGHHQVFVITHLPQLASKAHRHLLVEKRQDHETASTGVEELTGEDRVREIARMLGGDPDSETSREHARELLGVG